MKTSHEAGEGNASVVAPSFVASQQEELFFKKKGIKGKIKGNLEDFPPPFILHYILLVCC